MELTTDGRGVRHGLYSKSEKAVRARNQGVRRIMNHMLAIAPWLADSDRTALRAWCELEWLTRRVMLVLSEPDLPQEQMLKWSAEYCALRSCQNTIGNGLGLNATSRRQLGLRPLEQVIENIFHSNMYGPYLGMRTYRRLHVRLSKGDREKLDNILSGGVQAVRTVLRALVLCRLDKGFSASEVAAEVRLTAKAVREVGRRYEDRDLAQALYERPRPGVSNHVKLPP